MENPKGPKKPKNQPSSNIEQPQAAKVEIKNLSPEAAALLKENEELDAKLYILELEQQKIKKQNKLDEPDRIRRQEAAAAEKLRIEEAEKKAKADKKIEDEAEEKRQIAIKKKISLSSFTALKATGPDLHTDTSHKFLKKGLIGQAFNVLESKFQRLREATLGSMTTTQDTYQFRISRDHSMVGTYEARFKDIQNSNIELFEIKTGLRYTDIAQLSEVELLAAIEAKSQDYTIDTENLDPRLEKELSRPQSPLLIISKINHINEVLAKISAPLEKERVEKLKDEHGNILLNPDDTYQTITIPAKPGIMQTFATKGKKASSKQDAKIASHQFYKLLDVCEEELLGLIRYQKAEKVVSIAPTIPPLLYLLANRQEVPQVEAAPQVELDPTELMLQEMFNNSGDFVVNNISNDAQGNRCINVIPEGRTHIEQFKFNFSNTTYDQESIIAQIKAHLANKSNKVEYKNKKLNFITAQESNSNRPSISPTITANVPPTNYTLSATLPGQIAPVLTPVVPTTSEPQAANQSYAVINTQPEQGLQTFPTSNNVLKIKNIETKVRNDIASKFFESNQPVAISNVSYSNVAGSLFQISLINIDASGKQTQTIVNIPTSSITGKDSVFFEEMLRNINIKNKIVNVNNNTITFDDKINLHTAAPKEIKKKLINTEVQEPVQAEAIPVLPAPTVQLESQVEASQSADPITAPDLKQSKRELLNFENHTNIVDALDDIFDKHEGIVITGINDQNSKYLFAKIGSNKKNINLGNSIIAAQLISLIETKELINGNQGGINKAEFNQIKTELYVQELFEEIKTDKVYSDFFSKILTETKDYSNSILNFKLDINLNSLKIEGYKQGNDINQKSTVLTLNLSDFNPKIIKMINKFIKSNINFQNSNNTGRKKINNKEVNNADKFNLFLYDNKGSNLLNTKFKDTNNITQLPLFSIN